METERQTVLAESAAEGGTEINIGVMLALSPSAEVEPLRAFARQLSGDVAEALQRSARAHWIFHFEEPVRLSSDDVRRPSDFLDEASLRMVEGPYDLVLVITDVGLTSRRHRAASGLASDIANVAVLSTRRLLLTPRGEPVRTLGAESVRFNAGALTLHLLGHLLGLHHRHGDDNAMAPFRFDERRRTLPAFDGYCRGRVQRRVDRLPERELYGGGFVRTLIFHLSSAATNLRAVFTPLLRNRAPLLPLALPGLATAAVAPTFILVFTAEIWDVGLGMSEVVAWTFALGSILAATWYLIAVQGLFFPHEEKRVITEHMAVVNVTIVLTMLLAMIGLFLMVALLMLFVETYIFPAGLISTWPTLPDPQVSLWDKIRLASFISSVGVLTGALAGGLESRAVVRHLALFQDEP